LVNYYINGFLDPILKMENKYLLSLDGGGVREVATVIFLSKLEKALG